MRDAHGRGAGRPARRRRVPWPGGPAWRVRPSGVGGAPRPGAGRRGGRRRRRRSEHRRPVLAARPGSTRGCRPAGAGPSARAGRRGRGAAPERVDRTGTRLGAHSRPSRRLAPRREERLEARGARPSPSSESCAPHRAPAESCKRTVGRSCGFAAGRRGSQAISGSFCRRVRQSLLRCAPSRSEHRAARPASGPRPGWRASTSGSSSRGARARAAATQSRASGPTVSPSPPSAYRSALAYGPSSPAAARNASARGPGVGSQPQERQRHRPAGRVGTGSDAQAFTRSTSTRGSIQPPRCVGAPGSGAAARPPARRAMARTRRAKTPRNAPYRLGERHVRRPAGDPGQRQARTAARSRAEVGSPGRSARARSGPVRAAKSIGTAVAEAGDAVEHALQVVGVRGVLQNGREQRDQLVEVGDRHDRPVRGRAGGRPSPGSRSRGTSPASRSHAASAAATPARSASSGSRRRGPREQVVDRAGGRLRLRLVRRRRRAMRRGGRVARRRRSRRATPAARPASGRSGRHGARSGRARPRGPRATRGPGHRPPRSRRAAGAPGRAARALVDQARVPPGPSPSRGPAAPGRWRRRPVPARARPALSSAASALSANVTVDGLRLASQTEITAGPLGPLVQGRLERLVHQGEPPGPRLVKVAFQAVQAGVEQPRCGRAGLRRRTPPGPPPSETPGGPTGSTGKSPSRPGIGSVSKISQISSSSSPRVVEQRRADARRQAV